MRKTIVITLLAIAFSALFNFALAENAQSQSLLAFDEEIIFEKSCCKNLEVNYV